MGGCCKLQRSCNVKLFNVVSLIIPYIESRPPSLICLAVKWIMNPNRGSNDLINGRIVNWSKNRRTKRENKNKLTFSFFSRSKRYFSFVNFTFVRLCTNIAYNATITGIERGGVFFLNACKNDLNLKKKKEIYSFEILFFFEWIEFKSGIDQFSKWKIETVRVQVKSNYKRCNRWIFKFDFLEN